MGYCPWGHRESGRTEQLHHHSGNTVTTKYLKVITYLCGKISRTMGEIIGFFFFKEADLISVMSCPNFPGTVFFGCGTFSCRTEEVPGKLR